jgi:hypothetical protein
MGQQLTALNGIRTTTASLRVNAVKRVNGVPLSL